MITLLVMIIVYVTLELIRAEKKIRMLEKSTLIVPSSATE